MIHKACMPVYMNSGKIVADGTGRVGKSKVLQEVLADLKRPISQAGALSDEEFYGLETLKAIFLVLRRKKEYTLLYHRVWKDGRESIFHTNNFFSNVL